jgi:hypothetical protein
VQVSRKQLMLRAIHHRAMQLFLRKQRKLAAAAQAPAAAAAAAVRDRMH